MSVVRVQYASRQDLKSLEQLMRHIDFLFVNRQRLYVDADGHARAFSAMKMKGQERRGKERRFKSRVMGVEEKR